MKTSNDWAVIFKLHACINNKKFADQVQAIQRDAVESFIKNGLKTPKK